MPAETRAIRPPSWAAFTDELDAWSDSRRTAIFWWRDDDATGPSEALDRLLAIAGSRPIALAVIPALASESLAARVSALPNVSVLQHGYRHTNHAPASEKKSEYGPHRPIDEMVAEIERGRARLETLFGDRFKAIFVPPWNRIAEALPAILEQRGFVGVSCFGRRTNADHPKLVDTHVDLIDWHGGRGFVGTDTALAALVAQLAARREEHAGQRDPVGLLTHHLDHDDAGWDFIRDLVAVTGDHPAAAWLPATACVAGP